MINMFPSVVCAIVAAAAGLESRRSNGILDLDSSKRIRNDALKYLATRDTGNTKICIGCGSATQPCCGH